MAVPYPAGRRPALTVALVAFCATLVAPANAANFSDTASAAHTVSSAVLEPASNLTPTTGCGPLLSFSAEATLSWTATPSPFAAGYTVERWQGTSLESTMTVTPRTTTTITQTGLRTDTRYTWTVKAFMSSWTSSAVSVTASTPGTCL